MLHGYAWPVPTDAQSRTKTGCRWTVAFAWLDSDGQSLAIASASSSDWSLKDHEAAEQLLRLHIWAVGHDDALTLPPGSTS